MAIPRTKQESVGFFSLTALKGVANTVGAAPISHQASHDAIANLAAGAFPLRWFYNYAVTPWGYVGASPNFGFGVPMTDPGPDTTTLPIPAGVQFVPMFLDGSHVNTQEIAWAQPFAASSGYVITFNEPYGQGNMTVAQAIAAWPQVQAMADAVGAKIVAPSIGYGSSIPNQWLSDFMAAIALNGYRVDVLNYHATLGNYSGAFGVPGQTQAFFSGLDAMHAAFPSFPIWVTEWQLFTTNDAAGQAQLSEALDEINEGMISRPWVQRRAYWPLGTDPTKPGGAGFDTLSLCDAAGNLSTTGAYYVTIP